MFHRQKNLRDGLVKAAVFGANDGIITTFAVVTGVSGANLPTQVILILGIANMIADGISMGLGDYIGERSERKFQQNQHRTNHNQSKIGATSLITFIAFVVAGSLPLAPYFISFFAGHSFDNQLLTSALFTAFALLFIGGLRTVFTKGVWWKNSLEMFFIGAIAATASYVLGHLIRGLIGGQL